MPLLVLALLIGVFGYAWFARRNASLTRACLWRQQKANGNWRCAACGAVCTPEPGKEPRHCLRQT